MAERGGIGRRLAIALLGITLAVPAHAQVAGRSDRSALQQGEGELELTLPRMVEYALNTSYRVRQLNLNIERMRLNLKASRARLKSRADLDLTLPRINSISETRWNSELGRDVISRENSRRVEAELSVRQPVILFGYPTNGYLSLNHRMYRLSQHEQDEDDVRYYNRYFVRYTQPFFQSNELKNDLEEAELDLEEEELDFYRDVVDIIDNTSDDYFDLFEIAYERQMQDEVFDNIWSQPENTYTFDVEAELPIWDWGARDARIEAQEIGLEQAQLRIEETTADIRNDVANEVRNVREYEDRAFNMRENLTLAEGITETSLERYEEGSISALDLLQSLGRQVDTANNFLDAYLGWRRALQRIQEMTYFDFERDMRLLDRFGISFEEGVGNES